MIAPTDTPSLANGPRSRRSRVIVAVALVTTAVTAALVLARAGDALCLPADCTKYRGKLKLTVNPAMPGYTNVGDAEAPAYVVSFTVAGKIKGVPQRCLGGRYFAVRITNSSGSTDVDGGQVKTGKNGTFEEREEVVLEDPSERPKSPFRPGGVIVYRATVTSKAYVVYDSPLNPRTIKCAALRSRPVEVTLPEASFPP